ncbi:hypothetical protein CPB83DRAFT_857177 [Crepidotus variabilis]|uniref:Fe2OG dioxygenase domain-containing protein n=1 Tax=Crepidotus variabilis TaxID=179855 RepID=A0A9P6ED79_9AGAR|nr:hypothetical protein CPB83DRAFT_857177 [Crepidotus variabilis]
MDFTAVPILDYSLVGTPAGHSKFVIQLRHALINVGFLYLSNHPVSQDDIDLAISYAPRLFALPQGAKDAMKMTNSPHFMGYSKFGTEFTKGVLDQREQFDFATEHACRWIKPGDPEHHRLWGPCQWPEEKLIPGFREDYGRYLKQVEDLSLKFSSLMAEALGLGPDGLTKFYDPPELMQHRTKILKYPAADGSNIQGVGPHYDIGFLTILLQASGQTGLQVQNLTGEWVDVPPIPGTFVVNIGRALEFVTRGLARATSHRVLSPKGNAPRYSLPFFQNISLDAKLTEHNLEFPAKILALQEARGKISPTESMNFTQFDTEPYGKVHLIGRVKSHPDVAQLHYPEIFEKYFPCGYGGFSKKAVP